MNHPSILYIHTVCVTHPIASVVVIRWVVVVPAELVFRSLIRVGGTPRA